MKELEEITISMKEYKELLIIKGKYAELKNYCIFGRWDEPVIVSPNQPITYETAEPLPKPPYKITCNK